MSMYNYFGLKFGRRNVKVVLDWAELKNDAAHVAVWAGVNSHDNKSWVQGGIKQEPLDKKPKAYIEVKESNDPNDYHIHSWPMADYKIPVTVKLRRRNGMWRVTIAWGGNSETSRLIKVPNPVVDTCLEVMGKAEAICHINGQRVTSK